jgi:hypothetical protein
VNIKAAGGEVGDETAEGKNATNKGPAAWSSQDNGGNAEFNHMLVYAPLEEKESSIHRTPPGAGSSGRFGE